MKKELDIGLERVGVKEGQPPRMKKKDGSALQKPGGRNNREGAFKRRALLQRGKGRRGGKKKS